MRKYLLGILLTVAVLASCANPNKIAEQINVRGFVGMENTGYSDVTLFFDVDNASRKNICINGGSLVINDGKKTLVKVTVADIVIRKHTDEIVSVPLKISLNQLQLLASMNKLINRPGELTVTGEVTIKGGMLSKKFNFADKPLTEFLTEMGLDEQEIKKMLK